jgi:hypothetical protein
MSPLPAKAGEPGNPRVPEEWTYVEREVDIRLVRTGF